MVAFIRIIMIVLDVANIETVPFTYTEFGYKHRKEIFFMITSKELSGHPNTIRTLQKWIIAREKAPTSGKEKPNHYFYVGSDIDVTAAKECQLNEAGFKKEDYENMWFPTYYKAEDLAVIFSNELEDQNRHALRDLFHTILDSLKAANAYTSDKARCLILCDVFEHHFTNQFTQ